MSSYLVLARKYRPATFSEVIGQEAVTKLLAGAIDEGRIGHAYLFAGPRGTGKTTIARILARGLNCESGPTPTPCGACERCRSADEGREVDLIELDAASHTGVDTIRELRDEVAYAPMRARHKVYIIDEVHMLSKAAFNALLKTLEEPPAHVVFLFATTEPHRVLDTILSRCQVLRLAPLSEQAIADRLTEVFRLEGVEPGDGVVDELARGARGGMRDALSLADKLLALAGTAPTVDDLARLGGEARGQEIEAILDRIEAADRSGCLTALHNVRGDEDQLVVGLLEALRTALVLHHCGVDAPFVTVAESGRRAALERVERIGAERVELWLRELLRARERMRLLADQADLVLEVALLELCQPDRTLPLGELVLRLEELEGRLGADGRVPSSEPEAASRPAGTATPPAETSRAGSRRAPPSKSGAAPPSDPGALWDAFLEELRTTHGALATVLAERGGANRLTRSGDAFVLEVAPANDKERRLVDDRRNRAACGRAMVRVAGEGAALDLRVSKRGDAAAAIERPAPPSKDAFTEKVADLFGGVIEDIS